jgi:glutamate/tyrosine decarboxylase-like PLP-dependent enzyme
MTNFDLTAEERAELLNKLIPELEDYYENTADLRVAPPLDAAIIRQLVEQSDFTHPTDVKEAVGKVTRALRDHIVHITHPRYYGLFNPRPNFPSIMADLISGYFNPQLAAWSHSPYASEVENYLIREFGKKLGFRSDSVDGVFATGGAEANITAMLCALNNAFPEFANTGLPGMAGRPIVYCSSEAHHSVVRAARTSGLGKESVRTIPVNRRLEMQTEMLEKAIETDISAGFLPFMVIGTAGTTGSGSIDDLHEIKRISTRFGIWFHVDSAWGGAAILNDEAKKWIAGIEKADSVTLDVHKWMSVPMSASMFITSDREILGKTFRITTDYMPREAEDLGITDPYTHSIQWSRRFIGLKLFLSLMVFGWEGYSEIIGYQIRTGNILRKKLELADWKILNATPLPLVCFTDESARSDPAFTKNLCDSIVRSGEAWVSLYPVNGINTIRACITNYKTSATDIDALIETLNRLRSDIINKKTD